MLFKLQYIEKKKPHTNPLLIRGSITHRAISLYNSASWKLPEGEEQFHDTEQCVIQATKESPIKPNVQELAEIRKLMEGYASYTEIDKGGLIGVEVRLAMSVDRKETEWNDPKTWFRGIIDILRMKGSVAGVEDVKTGATRDQKQMENYAWLIMNLFPQIYEVETRFNMVPIEHLTPPVTYTRDEMPRIEQTIMEEIKHLLAAQKEGFNARLGDHCTLCDYRCYCPEIQAGVMTELVPPPTTPVLLDNLIREYYRAHTRSKALRVEITRFAELIGKIETPTAIGTWSPRLTWPDLDAETLVSVMKGTGRDPMQFLTLDEEKLRPAVEDPKLRRLLKAWEDLKLSFGLSRPKKKKGKEERRTR